MKMNFTATSGNKATLNERQRGNVTAIDVGWDTEPTRADISECNQWFMQQRDADAMLSTKTGSSSDAKRLADLMLGIHEDN